MTLLPTVSFRDRRGRLIRAVRERIAGGGILRGCFIGFTDPRIIDVWASAGIDLVALDLEHGAHTTESADEIIAAAVDAGVLPLVRVSATDTQLALRALDSGAAGVMVADVRTATQVREWRTRIEYPPAGTRGVSSTRALDWGLPLLTTDGASSPLLVPMLETLEASEGVRELVAAPGADWWHIGRTDLTADLTVYADAPPVGRVVDAIHAEAQAVGMPLGENGSLTDAAGAARARVVMVTDRQLTFAAGSGFADGPR
ncbi:aldolase/citrate lyase family protein [Microbacterium sp. CPCC 204701]|uniref:aldolase/citrate lyase family protein n=1 Tax=Microbacterium sp. CPCC 204701 TaxID=2493084 RepID=UPI000FDBF6CF|nr:aldolase/citrate lyase family protein [Microbacterium sp. CPCC 204701]